ncbi:MAG TPA: group 1 truncated hemoglobin [Thermoanaerobaculia bacterium]|jgi:hemoglobin|nr:group 1 truncated hemoglobin [Thermoanaerobaculia bacterium]
MRRFARLACALSLFATALPALAADAAVATAAQPSLYKRLGGYDALAAVTDDFIGHMAADPSLGKFFAGHSKESLGRIRQLVVDQLCAATGGPCVYIGRDMKSSHQGMGISEENWKAAAGYLVATLDKFKVPEKEKGEVLALVTTLHDDIVERPAMAAPAKP